MAQFRLGDIRVSSVLETELPAFGIRELIPGFDDTIVAEMAPSLAPRWIDLDQRKLVTTFQSYVIETPRRNILVDTGLGNDKTGRRRAMWNNARWPFLENLRMAGYAPEDIDIVVLTHIHVDHVGWNTCLVDGRWVPTFRNARYAIVGAELRDAEAKAKTEPHRYAALWADSMLPLLDARLIDEVASDHALDEGVNLAASPGHTASHVSVWIGYDRPRAVVTGDVLHHPVQLSHPELNSAACELAARARETRRALLEQCAAEDVLALPIHFEPCRVLPRGKAWDLAAP